MRVYVGIDWSRKSHAVCCIDGDKEKLHEFSISHEEEGFRALERRILKLADRDQILVGIETSQNVIVDFLLDAGFEVAPIHPNLIRDDRQSLSSSGAKSDPADAWLIARHLVNNADGLRILKPDSDETIALRQLVAERRTIVSDLTASFNRLGSLLERYLPAAQGLFSSFRCKVYRAFLRRFPNQDALDEASVEDFQVLLDDQGYRRKTVTAESIAKKVKAAPTGAKGLLGKAGASCIRAEVEKLDALLDISKMIEAEINKLLDDHPDGAIFRSLPGADTVMAAELLALFGDNRDRFQHAESLASLIGIVPVSKQSGRFRSVQFRRSCKKSGRRAFHIFTNLTRARAPWAAERYKALKDSGKRHPHAIRILGRSWLRIIHACWKARVPYDPKKTENRVVNKKA